MPERRSTREPGSPPSGGSGAKRPAPREVVVTLRLDATALNAVFEQFAAELPRRVAAIVLELKRRRAI